MIKDYCSMIAENITLIFNSHITEVAHIGQFIDGVVRNVENYNDEMGLNDRKRGYGYIRFQKSPEIDYENSNERTSSTIRAVRASASMYMVVMMDQIEPLSFTEALSRVIATTVLPKATVQITSATTNASDIWDSETGISFDQFKSGNQLIKIGFDIIFVTAWLPCTSLEIDKICCK